MPSATLRPHTDTWVGEEAPNQNHGTGVKIRVRGSGSGNERKGLIFFRPPFRRGATILSATLYLSAKKNWGAGTRTITARRIEESWREGRVTWANQPSASSTNEATLVVGALTDGEEIELDVTDQLQDHSDGDPFHGFKILLSTDEARAFYSSD